jgi:hypothetical protein
VRLYKTQCGRGPTRSRAHWAGPDTIVVILEETLAPAERNLVKMGEHQRLRDLRMFFQYGTVAELCEPIEQITGRKGAVVPERHRHRSRGSFDRSVRAAPCRMDGPSRSALAAA